MLTTSCPVMLFSSIRLQRASATRLGPGSSVWFRGCSSDPLSCTKLAAQRHRGGRCATFKQQAGGRRRAKGRHDPCVVPRAVPMVESMVALVLADHLLQVGAPHHTPPPPFPARPPPPPEGLPPAHRNSPPTHPSTMGPSTMKTAPSSGGARPTVLIRRSSGKSCGTGRPSGLWRFLCCT